MPRNTYVGILTCVLQVAFSIVAQAEEIATKANAINRTSQTSADSVVASEANQKILDVLRGNAVVRYDDVPLEKLLAEIADHRKIPIWIDESTLAEQGIDSATKITMTLPSVSLRSALTLMLAPHELDYTLRDETLCITAKSAIPTIQYSLVYKLDTRYTSVDVAELIQKVADAMRDKNCREPVVQMLTYSDGNTDGFSLFVRADRYTHKEVQNTLELLGRKQAE